MSAVTAPPAAAIEVADVWQTYPGVQALSGVSLAIRGGEVLGLVGHNGAGKSTLTRILGGVERPASGRLLVRGEEQSFHGPQDAIEAGISVVPQALNVVPSLTVWENVVLGMRLGRGDAREELEQRIRAVAAQLGIERELRSKAGDCSPSVQRLVMIARALLRQPAVMLLDEPTAALHPEEADRMFRAVEALRAQGVAIVFISHRLDEVLRVSGRVVVLRQGRVVAEALPAELTKSRLAELIAGRELDATAALDGATASAEAEVILRCEQLAVAPVVHDVSLDVARGEVVGLAGLEGAGCGTVLRTVAGLLRPVRGSVTLHHRPLKHTRRAAINAGVAYLPDDRVHNGIVPEMTVAATVTLSGDRAYRVRRWLPVLRIGREAKAVERLLERLDLHPRGAARKQIKFLSGGNQQKALMARALSSGADVYLFDQPTEGVDVGARQELHRHIRELAAEGGAVLVTSSESDELVGLCDRVVVMHDGRVVRELRGREISEAEIVHATLVG
jgi:ABC-type sugar transport system ATPase subunit